MAHRPGKGAACAESPHTRKISIGWLIPEFDELNRLALENGNTSTSAVIRALVKLGQQHLGVYPNALRAKLDADRRKIGRPKTR